MGQPTTFEEAVAKQLTQDPEHYSRTLSLKDGYEMRRMPDYGTGIYPVNIATGEVCEWNGKWDDTGSVLLCQDCFLDGT